MPERPGCIPPGMVGLDPEAVPLASPPTSFPHGEAGEKAWGSPSTRAHGSGLWKREVMGSGENQITLTFSCESLGGPPPSVCLTVVSAKRRCLTHQFLLVSIPFVKTLP